MKTNIRTIIFSLLLIIGNAINAIALDLPAIHAENIALQEAGKIFMAAANEVEKVGTDEAVRVMEEAKGTFLTHVIKFHALFQNHFSFGDTWLGKTRLGKALYTANTWLQETKPFRKFNDFVIAHPSAPVWIFAGFCAGTGCIIAYKDLQRRFAEKQAKSNMKCNATTFLIGNLCRR